MVIGHHMLTFVLFKPCISSIVDTVLSAIPLTVVLSVARPSLCWQPSMTLGFCTVMFPAMPILDLCACHKRTPYDDGPKTHFPARRSLS